MNKRFLGVMFIGLVCLLISVFGSGCISENADSLQRKETEAKLTEAHAQIGMPAIVNFQERKFAKMLFELRDQENLITYAYIVSLEGKLIFLGKCIGFGLPYSVQYTNPMKRIYGGSGSVTIPQADPNGLFMPDGLSATWLMMIDTKTGKHRPVYVEPQIIVSPFPLHNII